MKESKSKSDLLMVKAMALLKQKWSKRLKGFGMKLTLSRSGSNDAIAEWLFHPGQPRYLVRPPAINQIQIKETG